jgi:hypothetical protein
MRKRTRSLCDLGIDQAKDGVREKLLCALRNERIISQFASEATSLHKSACRSYSSPPIKLHHTTRVAGRSGTRGSFLTTR